MIEEIIWGGLVIFYDHEMNCSKWRRKTTGGSEDWRSDGHYGFLPCILRVERAFRM
jgi:hypothetical protein